MRRPRCRAQHSVGAAAAPPAARPGTAAPPWPSRARTGPGSWSRPRSTSRGPGSPARCTCNLQHYIVEPSRQAKQKYKKSCDRSQVPPEEGEEAGLHHHRPDRHPGPDWFGPEESYSGDNPATPTRADGRSDTPSTQGRPAAAISHFTYSQTSVFSFWALLINDLKPHPSNENNLQVCGFLSYLCCWCKSHYSV